MLLGDFKKLTKDFDDATDIQINNSDCFHMEYREHLFSQIPKETPTISTGVPFKEKRIEITTYDH